MRVCVASNSTVDRHCHPGAGHPERPARIHAIEEALVVAGLHQMIEIRSSRQATIGELARAHDRAYLEGLRERVCHGEGKLDRDTYYSAGTWPAVRSAAGAGVELVTEALQSSNSGFFGLALCRPPGHHAGIRSSQGFCLVNNVAVAAKAALARGARRVAIVDWDAHHGNGTQEIFYRSSAVLVMSCHRHPYYPNTGSPDARGAGPGRGYNINVPLQKGMGDAEVVATFRRVFVPQLISFRPEITLVSAGFDGHRWELLGGLEMSERGYRSLTAELVGSLAEHGNRRLVAVLEGGYDLEALGRCVCEVVAGAVAGDAGSKGTAETRDGGFLSLLRRIDERANRERQGSERFCAGRARMR
jgi:acetoin utilization deacetylase AcuC-like enzyme